MTKEEAKTNLDALVKGEQSIFTIQREDFMIVRECWLDHAEKENIIGHAKHNGIVEYHYVSEHIAD